MLRGTGRHFSSGGSRVFRFCVSKGLLAIAINKSGNHRSRDEATHYIMNGFGGGWLILPDTLADEFYNMYADDIGNGVEHFLVERRTPVFRFLVDLDIEDETPVPRETVCRYTADIQEVLKKFFGGSTGSRRSGEAAPDEADGADVPDPAPQDSLFDAIVCDTVPKSLGHDVGGRPLTKTGVHIIFPNLHVDVERSLTMREAVVASLERKYGVRPIGKGWSDVVDEAVYTSNGLRMIGSHKWVRCGACRGKTGLVERCEECLMVGFRTEARPYLPFAVVSGADGRPDEDAFSLLRENVHHMVRRTSIRLLLARLTPGWGAYRGAPSYVPPGGGRQRTLAPPSERRFAEDAKVLGATRNKIYVREGTPASIAMLEFVRHNFGDAYANILIDDMFTNPSASHYIVTTKGDGSSYCMNYQRDHRSNRIYFWVDHDGVCQRCFCRCNDLTNRISGKLCKDYRSKSVPLPPSLDALLWPGGASVRIGALNIQRNNTWSANHGAHMRAVHEHLIEHASRVFPRLHAMGRTQQSLLLPPSPAASGTAREVAPSRSTWSRGTPTRSLSSCVPAKRGIESSAATDVRPMTLASDDDRDAQEEPSPPTARKRIRCSSIAEE